VRVDSLQIETTGGPTTAYVDRPENNTNTAVILIHEWWGINQHVRDIARRYAAEGYNCVAPDLYRGRVTQDAEEASTWMHALAIEDGLETIQKAIDAARDAYGFDQFVITGYCMGGTFALRAACEIPELKAAAPFYGDLPEDDVLQKLSVPTLFIAGNRDNWITPQKVDGLRAAATKQGLPVETVSYDADHAFFNDTRPDVYNEGAAQDAWQRVLRHFERYTHADQTETGRPATFP
jgi:carboxymethylenebutenolidase